MDSLNLQKLDLREIGLPLKAPFETSFGTAYERRILVLRVFDRDGAVGYGECTAPEEPFFNPETIDTAWIIITKHIAPLLAKARVGHAEDVSQVLAPIRGNRMAIGAVETAIWELESKIAGKPLWQHLGGKQAEINCGVSIGLQRSTDILLEKVTREVESGYRAHQAENKARTRPRACQNHSKRVSGHTAFGRCKFGISSRAGPGSAKATRRF